jgi:predicted amidohydrolase
VLHYSAKYRERAQKCTVAVRVLHHRHGNARHRKDLRFSVRSVFDTAFGTVGLAMCSEVYMPEVARALALRGAEVIFMPAGREKKQLWATWRTLIWARAIENLAIVVTTQNLFSHAERGLAMVAAPEEILFESTVAGLAVVDVSLDRLRAMRASRDEVGSSNDFGAKQGVLGPQWQRPELYEAIYPRPHRQAAE